MSVLVEVTQEDIDKGDVGNCRRCPIAIALNRRIPSEEFSVGVATVRVMSTRKCFYLPPEAAQFVRDFDYKSDGYPPSPFKFWFPTVPHYATGGES